MARPKTETSGASDAAAKDLPAATEPADLSHTPAETPPEATGPEVPAETPAETPAEIAAETPAVAEETAPPETAPEPPEERLIEALSEGDTRAEEVTPEPPAAADPPAPPQQPQVIHKGPGFVPLVLGGVVAALIGAGGTIFALPHLPPQLAGFLPSYTPDTSAFDTALAEQKSQIDSLRADIDTLKAAPPQAADLSGVQGVLDEASSGVRNLTDRLSTVEDRLATLETRPVVTPDGAPIDDSTVAALQSQIDGLRQQVATAGQPGADAQQQITEAAEAARAQIDTVQAETQRLRAESEAAVHRSIAQASIARVAAALQSGVPLAPALADAEAAGLTVPAALRANIPSLPVLQASFPEAARNALAAARKSAAGETFWQRAGAFLTAQTGARSVVPREGNSPDAILSRAQAAVDAGDIGKALAEIDTLPQAAQAMLSGWISQAQTRIAATEAMGELAQSVQ
ncbi:hypothetical protein D2T29_07475 [Sinirhodobacter populi]|uniref:Mitochondrial inner membrane protein n=1 Tax=Paenirhodobacter populi TaxID=2306993 RepID=A0A443KK98_9RHOB|nr:hypothetical protein [Sinirhodobacter populi]RWR33187.1 hypothetical protein D2T29_07475 [Sinirhodobacter populi]